MLVVSRPTAVGRWVCAGWLVMCLVYYGSLVAEDVTQRRTPELVQQNLESKQEAKEKGANLLVVGKHLMEWKPYSVNIISLCTAIFAIGGGICKMISNRKDSKTRSIFSQTEKSTECVQDMAVQTELSFGEGMLFDKCHERSVCNKCHDEIGVYYSRELQEMYDKKVEELQAHLREEAMQGHLRILKECKNKLSERRGGLANDKQVGNSSND